MKKNLLVCVMALAAVFALTGCKKGNNGGETTTTQPAEKKLSCSLSNGGNTSRITFTYEGNDVKKATMSITEKQKDEKTAKSEYEKAVKEMPEVNKNKGVSMSASYSGTLVTGTYSFTIADMDDAAKILYDEVFEEFKNKDYDAVKTALTDAGYKCN